MIINGLISFAQQVIQFLLAAIPTYASQTTVDKLLGPVSAIMNSAGNSIVGVFVDPSIIAEVFGALLSIIVVFYTFKFAIFVWQQVKW